MAFGEDGRCLIIRWDDSVCINRMAQGKEFPGSLSHCLCNAHIWSRVTECRGFSTDAVQIFCKVSSLTAKAALGLVFYISLFWKLGNYPVWSLLSTTKEYESWKDSWVSPVTTLSGASISSTLYLISDHVDLTISMVGYSVMPVASSFCCSLFSGSFASHWDFGIFVTKHYHTRSWLLQGVFCLTYPDNFTSPSICIAERDLPLAG